MKHRKLVSCTGVAAVALLQGAPALSQGDPRPEPPRPPVIEVPKPTGPNVLQILQQQQQLQNTINNILFPPYLQANPTISPLDQRSGLIPKSVKIPPSVPINLTTTTVKVPNIINSNLLAPSKPEQIVLPTPPRMEEKPVQAEAPPPTVKTVEVKTIQTPAPTPVVKTVQVTSTPVPTTVNVTDTKSEIKTVMTDTVVTNVPPPTTTTTTTTTKTPTTTTTTVTVLDPSTYNKPEVQDTTVKVQDVPVTVSTITPRQNATTIYNTNTNTNTNTITTTTTTTNIPRKAVFGPIPTSAKPTTVGDLARTPFQGRYGAIVIELMQLQSERSFSAPYNDKAKKDLAEAKAKLATMKDLTYQESEKLKTLPQPGTKVNTDGLLNKAYESIAKEQANIDKGILERARLEKQQKEYADQQRRVASLESQVAINQDRQLDMSRKITALEKEARALQEAFLQQAATQPPAKKSLPDPIVIASSAAVAESSNKIAAEISKQLKDIDLLAAQLRLVSEAFDPRTGGQPSSDWLQLEADYKLQLEREVGLVQMLFSQFEGTSEPWIIERRDLILNALKKSGDYDYLVKVLNAPKKF